jgi:hypothetical protein
VFVTINVSLSSPHVSTLGRATTALSVSITAAAVPAVPQLTASETGHTPEWPEEPSATKRRCRTDKRSELSRETKRAGNPGRVIHCKRERVLRSIMYALNKKLKKRNLFDKVFDVFS